MLVMTATVSRPFRRPMETMASASCRALSRSLMKAPLPIFTSSTSLSAPEASFLLITLLAIRGMLATVAVTSRRA